MTLSAAVTLALYNMRNNNEAPSWHITCCLLVVEKFFIFKETTL